MSWKQSIIGLARTGRSLGDAKPAKERSKRQRRAGKNTLSDETVAQIKRDLKTMSVLNVAIKYNLKPGRIADIERGITYSYVKVAA